MNNECSLTSPHHHQTVCGERWLEQVQRRMLAAGYRLTGARLQVLTWVARQEQPFSAEDAVNALGRHFGQGSRSTIYRLLHLLREEHWLGRVSVDGREQSFLRQLQGHHIAICLKCGFSMLIGGCDLDAVTAPSLDGSGFAVQRQELSIYGWCIGCRPIRPLL